ncbi:MAG: 3-hydroxyacyl-CoA dehydrogenase family protein, partial [Clostridiales Family XIII bacterium]|nr:3-hydroxyacyl-CoA dehydrogenase family protein [Clostridiales Family XIII bacterium]
MEKLSDIKKIAVLGAGTMGPGIAQIFAIGGYDVVMWTRREETREKAKETLKKSLVTFAEEGLIPADKVDEIFRRVGYAQAVADAVSDADFIMETIVENRDAKIDIYAQIDAAAKEDAIIASNTSALNIFEIMPEKRLPHTVIAHWYAPPQLIPLVEVVKSEQAPQILADITEELLKKCGKTPVVMKKFINGYIANRMQMCLNQEVFYLLDNGYCTPEDIDLAVKASFVPRAVVLGICKRIDFGGVDMTANNFRNKSYVPPN